MGPDHLREGEFAHRGIGNQSGTDIFVEMGVRLEFGIALSSEEHSPRELVGIARIAEEAGFGFASISDHFHPWTSQQGNSPFVWAVLGGIAMTTEMPGRFFLGLGTGESLNEHVTGARWPESEVRLEMLEEAIDVIRKLWSGKNISHRGRHYTIENARIFTLPPEDAAIPIYLASSGSRSMDLVRRAADGLIATSPTIDLDDTGLADKPRLGKITICYAEDETEAARIALRWWPNAALSGELGQELPVPKHFEQATGWVTEQNIVEHIVCGPDVDRYLEAIRSYVEAGFDHVWFHQVGPSQQAAMEFLATKVVPAASQVRA